MANRVMEVLTIDDAYCSKGKCPFCGKNTENLEKHLKRCQARKLSEDAEGRLRADPATGERVRWAVHNDCGRVMILELNKGLALIENNSRRYVVPAMDLTAGGVGIILEQIHKLDLSEDQIKELVGHLLSMIHNVQVHPFIRAGNRVEFLHMGKLTVGRIKRRHGPNSYIIESQSYTGNIGRKDIISIVE